VILLSLVLVLLSLGLLIAGLAGASQALVWASIVSSVVAGGCLALAVLQRRAAPGDDEGQDALTAGEGVPVAATVSGAATAGTAASGGTVTGAARAGAPTDHVDAPEVPTRDADSAAERLTGAVAAGSGVAASTTGPAATSVPAADPAVPPEESTEPVAVAEDDPPTVAVAAAPAEAEAEAGTDAEDAFEDAYPDPPGEPPEEDVSAPDALRVIDLDVDVFVVDGRPRYHLEDCPHLADREVIPLPVPEAREAGFTPCSLCKPDSKLAAQARKARAAAKAEPTKAEAPKAEAPKDAPQDAEAPKAEAPKAEVPKNGTETAPKAPAEDAGRR
jgi:hypothetical protein